MLSCKFSVDLRKVFDTLGHEILLIEFELNGIRGIGLEWSKSYLSDRCLCASRKSNLTVEQSFSTFSAKIV